MASQEAVREHCVEQLRERGYISVAFGFKATDIDPIFSDFNEFFDMSHADAAGQELVNALAYQIPGRDKDGQYWILRQREGVTNPYEPGRDPATESKDTAMLGPQSMARARDLLGLRMPRVMRRLLDDCTELHESAKKSIRPLFEVLGVDDLMLARDPMDDVHLIRVLRYVGTQATHQAGLHFDRAKFTFAAWESHPGLVGAPGNNTYPSPVTLSELEDMATRANNTSLRHRSGEGKVFAGAGYNRLRAEVRPNIPNIPLLLHGVRNEKPGEECNAIVIFMNQHIGVDCSVAPPSETGFEHIRTLVAQYDPLAQTA